MDIESDGETDLDSALSLAIEHGLTFYDALYLELAVATIDCFSPRWIRDLRSVPLEVPQA